MATLTLSPPVAVSVAAGKLLTVSNSITLAGTDSTTMTFPSTSATIARTDAGQTFTGTNAFGVITVTSINSLTISTSTGTLTIANGKTLTANNSLTLAGTDGKTLTLNNSMTLAAGADSQTWTFPSSSDTVACLGTINTFTVRQNVTTTANVQSFQITNNTITTGSPMAAIVSTSITSGSMLQLEQSTSTFTGNALFINMQDGSGTFSGNAIQFEVNGSSMFSVDHNGNPSGGIFTSLASNTNRVGLDASAITTAGSGAFKSASAMESTSLSTGTVTIKNTTASSVNNTGFVTFIDHNGTARKIPYV